MGAAGRQRVLEHFSSEQCVQHTLEVYRSLQHIPLAWRTGSRERTRDSVAH
jgi:hypothetical protein